MAEIMGNSASNILKIHKFLGLNENPDGDTSIKNGEMAVMRDWKITQDGHLQLRPGQKTVLNFRTAWDALPDKPDIPAPRFCGAWHGVVDAVPRFLAAFGGVLFNVLSDGTIKDIGRATEDDTTFFGFANKVYLLNGHEYLSWDGGVDSKFTKVEGYVPTIITASTPDGLGVMLENVNRLTGLRKAKFSPDGKAASFQLPEKEIDEVTSVEGASGKYTLDAAKGVVKFDSAPEAAINTLIITYRKGNGERAQVEKMHFSELYNGVTDARVFLYGDGTNKTIYSGADLETGKATADYFPDLFEADIGEENTPITSMVRHYSRLMVYKPNSAWSLDYTIQADAGGRPVAAFQVIPVNRQIGNMAPGQVRLLENNPLSLDSDAVYQWKSMGGGNITRDNRNADRVSDRVKSTFTAFDLTKTKTFNRQYWTEYWFLYGGRAAILNYETDSWYVYTNMDFVQMEEVDGEAYGFRADGTVAWISRRFRSDDGKPIKAYAETGSMDFSKDWLRKYSPQFFVAIKPETGARLKVTVQTNRRSIYNEKWVSSGLAAFVNVDFRHFSFGTNRKPQVRRIKIKVKKAVFYKMVFKSDWEATSSTATVLGVDTQSRFGSAVK